MAERGRIVGMALVGCSCGGRARRTASGGRDRGHPAPGKPGKTAAHIERTRDGRYALLSIREMDGAIVVYDAQTLEEVRRIPMVKPSGKYDVWNKIHGSEGASH